MALKCLNRAMLAGWLAVAYTNRATETETLTHTVAPHCYKHTARHRSSCLPWEFVLCASRSVAAPQRRNILADLAAAAAALCHHHVHPQTVRPRGLQMIAPKTCKNHFLKSSQKQYFRDHHCKRTTTLVQVCRCGKAVRISPVDVRAVLSIRTTGVGWCTDSQTGHVDALRWGLTLLM